VIATDSDQAAFVAAVEAIYAAAPEPSRWPDALQAIADVFDDVGSVLVFGRDDGSFGAIGSPSMDTMLSAWFSSSMAGQDLRAIRGAEIGFFLGRDAVSDPDLVSAKEMETHPYYKFLASHGLKYFVAAPISPDPRVSVSIAVQRSLTKRPYVREDLELMTRLCRHAEKALRLSIRLLNAELGSLGLRQALSRLAIGVFALDTLGRVVFSNPAGERLIGDGLSLTDGRLVIRQGGARDELERAIRSVLKAVPEILLADPKPLLVDRVSMARPLTVYVLPVGVQRNPAEEFLTHVRALVLAIDPETNAPPDPAVVRDVLGLTLGEARVAALVGTGLAPREAAAKLGITEETARTTLKRVFAKVGVSRQSELAALLTKLVLR
jgi:DNA-binding CsgD family transcriptional regulator/PAS domain-containing protein